MAKKISIPIKDAHRIINTGPVVLVSSRYEGSASIATIAWNMPVSASPKLMAVALAHTRYTLELIRQSKNFCINLPDYSLLEKVIFCGTYSGRARDKFKEAGLSPADCRKISACSVEECAAQIECELVQLVEAGDHTIVIGEVVDAYANEDVINADGVIDINRVDLIQHLGGSHFGTVRRK